MNVYPQMSDDQLYWEAERTKNELALEIDRRRDRVTEDCAELRSQVENLQTRVVTGIPAAPATDPQKLTGGKLSGDHYYRVSVAAPINPELEPYEAECSDIIEALGMTFNEGEVFKALWRGAARRQGRGKPGGTALYDAEKIAHYGARVLAQLRSGAL